MEFQLKHGFMSTQVGVPDKWTSDSKCFILENFDTICNSPSQIYGTALALCPSSSWLYGCYNIKFPLKIKVVVGPDGWGTSTHTVSCNNDHTTTLTCQNNTIATGLHNEIAISDAFTGSQTSVLSGHTGWVQSLAFSSDETLLASGSRDKTIKLWDVQTYGVIKTFYGHTGPVDSVCISADNTMIASGSRDGSIRLWDIMTGGHHVIEGYRGSVGTINFSPTDPQLLLSVSGDGTVQKWNIYGHQISSPIAGSYVAFSPDGTQFALCRETAVAIKNTNSGVTVAEFCLAHAEPNYCCFSPDGRFIACAAHHTIYLWDITGPNPHLIKTLLGHTEDITSLVFSSSLLTLVSASLDNSIKFWEIGASSANPVTLHTESMSLTPAPIRAVSLQAKDGLAFSVDSVGVVRAWNIMTGLCKETFATQAKDIYTGDMQLIGGRLIIVGCKWSPGQGQKIHIWDADRGELQIMDGTRFRPRGLRMSGDRSRVFCVDDYSIQAWSIQTGVPAGKASLESRYPYLLDPLWIDGSKVFIRHGKSSTLGWDIGTPGSTLSWVPLIASERPHLDFIGGTSKSSTGLIGVEDRATGKVVFQLYSTYAKPSAIQWDGHYLIAGYESGEVLILDFSCMLP